MSKTVNAAVICELNPFHNGHEYLFSRIRKEHPDGRIICLMSGNYVQRGDVAIADKYLRARMAVEWGVDLVLELPLPFSIMSAEGFARGGVHILNRLGGIDYLYFGSECGDTQLLAQAAKRLLKDDFQKALKNNLVLHRDMTYPSAISLTYQELYGEDCSILASPNDVLGLEYIKALQKSDSTIAPVAIKRIGAEHDGENRIGKIASASAIRRMMTQGDILSSDYYLPNCTFHSIDHAYRKNELPITVKHNEKLILSDLRRKSKDPDYFQSILYCNSLEEKLVKEIPEAVSLEQLIAKLKSKNYTQARIRRALLCAYLGIERELSDLDPDYSCVLALSEKGRKYLAEIRKTKQIPVITKPGNLNELAKSSALVRLNIIADRRYTVFYPQVKPESALFRISPYYRE